MNNTAGNQPTTDRWTLESVVPPSIVWNVGEGASSLPHSDHVEMSGRRVSATVRYGVDEQRRLSVAREVLWPQLRTREGDVRGYTRRAFSTLPRLIIGGEEVALGPVDTITFDGQLHFVHDAAGGLRVHRTLLPSMSAPVLVEQWHLQNVSACEVQVEVHFEEAGERTSGVYGDYLIRAFGHSGSERLPIRRVIAPGAHLEFKLCFGAAVKPPGSAPTEVTDSLLHAAIEADMGRKYRTAHLLSGGGTLHLETPDPVVNAAFAFAKLRACESLFETAKMGLVHSPGGGNYYGGVWANDQAEYSGPLFAFLSDPDVNEAAVNAYRVFASHMAPDYRPVPTSMEMEGTIEIHAGGDRGDAAMIASGLTRYLLTRGDRALAEEFWPAVEWCLEYCRRKTNAAGVVESDSDELEGRFPTGDANLSTSSLCYDGLRRAADLARSLGKSDAVTAYEARAGELAAAVEAHFGTTVEGFETYRYYEGNTVLRSWICLPLCFGLAQSPARRDGTVAALFSPRLWTADGLATQAGDTTFWDRSTLYGLRGVFFAGATEEAFGHLLAYTRRRLLGDHVPYPVEAYPENAQAHLSAESALYCRVFIEGMFGIVPTGLRSFDLTPRLPAAWDQAALTLRIAGYAVRVSVRREGADALRVTVRDASAPDAAPLYDGPAAAGATHTVHLPE